MLGGLTHRLEGRKMYNTRNIALLFQNFGQLFLAGQVGLVLMVVFLGDFSNSIRDGWFGAAVVVYAYHLITCFKQCYDRMRSDIPGASGQQNLGHGLGAQ